MKDKSYYFYSKLLEVSFGKKKALMA